MTPVGRGDIIPTMGAIVDWWHPNGALHWHSHGSKMHSRKADLLYMST